MWKLERNGSPCALEHRENDVVNLVRANRVGGLTNLNHGRLVHATEEVIETVQVYRAGKHREVSTLMVPESSDNEDIARIVATFVVDRLESDVATRFVRFHSRPGRPDLHRVCPGIVDDTEEWQRWGGRAAGAGKLQQSNAPCGLDVLIYHRGGGGRHSERRHHIRCRRPGRPVRCR